MDWTMKFFIFSVILYGAVVLGVKIAEKKLRKKSAVVADENNDDIFVE